MEAKKPGTKLDLGVFAENITTEGLELHKTNVFDRFIHKDVVLEVTQIGKKCHHGCEIMKQIGDCVMPVEGIFAKVIKAGTLNTGEALEYAPRIIKTLVITLSDRAFNGIYEDKSGLGKRDITPDVVRPLLDKEIPGIMEHIRLKYGAEKHNALISRSIAGVMDSALVYVLPGSVKGVNEYLTEITPTIEHSLRMIHGVDNH